MIDSSLVYVAPIVSVMANVVVGVNRCVTLGLTNGDVVGERVWLRDVDLVCEEEWLNERVPLVDVDADVVVEALALLDVETDADDDCDVDIEREFETLCVNEELTETDPLGDFDSDLERDLEYELLIASVTESDADTE